MKRLRNSTKTNVPEFCFSKHTKVHWWLKVGAKVSRWSAWVFFYIMRACKRICFLFCFVSNCFKTWFKLLQNGSNWVKIVPSASYWFRMVLSGSNCLKMVQIALKWFNIFQNCSKSFKMVKTGSAKDIHRQYFSLNYPIKSIENMTENDAGEILTMWIKCCINF